MNGNSLVVQLLRLCAPNAGGMGSIPGQGTKIPHAARRGQKKKINKYRERKVGKVNGGLTTSRKGGKY